MRKSRLQRQRQKRLITLIVFFGVILFFGFLVMKVVGFFHNISVNHPSTPNATPTPKVVKTSYTIAILGYGGGVHDGTYLTDTIMVAHVDLKTKKAILVSVPRDTYVSIPTKKAGDDYHEKINALYQMGLYTKDYPALDDSYVSTDKAGFIKNTLKEITGLPIDDYVAIDFAGFTKTIDILGGVDINVDKTFTDYEYPIDGKEKDLCGKDEMFAKVVPFLDGKGDDKEKENVFKDHDDLKKFFDNITESPAEAFPCRYETLKFTAGPTHMDGATALKYARSRHSLQDGGDFNRAKRQQNVIQAVKEKILSIGFIPKILPLMDELGNHIKTDIPGDDIKKFMLEAPKVKEYTIVNLVLSQGTYLESGKSEYGAYILVSVDGQDKWTTIRKDINNIILGITPTPTPTITPSITLTPKASLTPKVSITPTVTKKP